MEAKERWKGWQWRANLRALHQRVQQRLRIASSPRALIVRLQQQHNRKALVNHKPVNALLSTFLAKHFKFAAASAGAVALPSNPRHPVVQHEYTDSNYTAVFDENSSTVRFLQAVALPLIGNVCHAFMHGLNRMEVYCVDKILDAVSHRPQGQPLITVSNHVASMDDPLVLAAMLPPHVLLQAQSLRWTLCATDRCFTNFATSAFFQCVRVLPLARGAGVYQKGVDMAVEKLKRGDWVHIFPEGSRSRDGGKTVQSAKRGIGRLVLDAGKVPLVIPFVHSGMQDVMPIGSKFPSIKKRVVVLVGDPIEMDDLVLKFHEGTVSKSIIHEAIAFRVGQCLKKLKEELDLIVASNSNDYKEKQYNQRNRSEYLGNGEAGKLDCRSLEKNRKRDLDSVHRHGGIYDPDGLSEALSLRSALPFSDEALPRIYAAFSEEGIITRLKRPIDSAVFVGFAAQGLLRHGLAGLGRAGF